MSNSLNTGVNNAKIVIVANGAPYGSESLFNSLRLAIALREQESNLDLRLFLMSDAVTAGLRGQNQGKATTFSKCWRSLPLRMYR